MARTGQTVPGCGAGGIRAWATGSRAWATGSRAWATGIRAWATGIQAWKACLRPALLAACPLLLSTLPGCGVVEPEHPRPLEPGECREDLQCPPPLVCVRGRGEQPVGHCGCIPPLAGAPDAGLAGAEHRAASDPGAPLPHPGTGCPGGMSCGADGRCHCGTDLDCPAGQRCSAERGGTCVCEDEAGCCPAGCTVQRGQCVRRDAENDDLLLCTLPDRANPCGGRAPLPHLPGEPCDPLCHGWSWQCGPDPDGPLLCRGSRGQGEHNLCGGCEPLQQQPGEPCRPGCPTWRWECDAAQPERLVCRGPAAEPPNRCGGCANPELDARLGQPCPAPGSCGRWVCDGPDNLTCADPGRNACGGCRELRDDGLPGDECLELEEPATLRLDPAGDGLVPGGGCTRQPDALSYCGWLTCQQVAGTEDGPSPCAERWRMTCADDQPNACGGCGPLEYWPAVSLPGPDEPAPREGEPCLLPPEAAQAVPSQGRWTCAQQQTMLVCRPLGLNLCGGQTPLPGIPGELCGFCSRYHCSADREGLDCLPVQEPPPGRPEVCNGQDDDCDRLIDMADPDLHPAQPLADEQRGVCAGARKTCDGLWGWREPAYGELPGYEARETRCDGLDNDCDGETDEVADLAGAVPAAALQLGVCFGSTQVCSDGPCADGAPRCWNEPDYRLIPHYEAVEQSCDGLDNDCDGLVDEELELPPGEPPCLADGVCQGVQKTCRGGAGWGCPYPETWEAVETSCDGLDNDCDGLVDEELVPPLASFQGGVCAGARQVCRGLRGWEDPDYHQLAGYEDEEASCDGRDNDCDGDTDEGFFVDWPCQLPGVCGVGRWRCNPQDPAQFECSAIDRRSDEVCNGVDDDCDGAVDEQVQPPPGFPPCLDLGVCRGAVPGCRGQDGWSCSYPVSYEPVEQTCDGLDNDCDGLTDEALIEPAGLCLAAGVCTGTHPTCEHQAGWICHYPNSYERQTELSCDGLDNDCDGLTDEALTPPAGFTCLDRGVCAGTTPVCDRAWTCRYPAGYELIEQTCDGLDNDCDGATDETFPIGGWCYLPGICGSGVSRCAANGFGTECSSLDRRQPEICGDGLDNDCDGSVDEPDCGAGGQP